jgi:hypothetical protein
MLTACIEEDSLISDYLIQISLKLFQIELLKARIALGRPTNFLFAHIQNFFLRKLLAKMHK